MCVELELIKLELELKILSGTNQMELTSCLLFVYITFQSGAWHNQLYTIILQMEQIKTYSESC